jgi:hypothetical protein
VRVDFSPVFDHSRFSYRIKIDPSSGSLSVEAIARRRRGKVLVRRFFEIQVWAVSMGD